MIRASQIPPPVQSPVGIIWARLAQQPEQEQPIRDSGYRYPTIEEQIYPTPVRPESNIAQIPGSPDLDDSFGEVEALISDTTETKAEWNMTDENIRKWIAQVKGAQVD